MPKQEIPVLLSEASTKSYGFGMVMSYDFDDLSPYIELELYATGLRKRFTPSQVKLYSYVPSWLEN